MMKRTSIIIMTASLFTACGIYKPYTHPEIRTDNLYGAEYSTTDTTSVADIGWYELFSDERLQRLIDTALCKTFKSSFLIETQTIRISILLNGNDLETSELHLFAIFCIKSKEHLTALQR